MATMLAMSLCFIAMTSVMIIGIWGLVRLLSVELSIKEFYNLPVQCTVALKEFLSAPKHGTASADTSILHFKVEQLCMAGRMTIKS